MTRRSGGEESRRGSAPALPAIDENALVRRFQERFGGRSPLLRKGIGDDAAVLHPRGAREHWVVTTDMLVEGVDFRAGWMTPKELGHKALAVNLSDIAAMGCRPRFHTVALAIEPAGAERWISSFYEGMAGLGAAWNCILIGGDLSRSPAGTQITITALGESVGAKPVYRSGGKSGDLLYVTGVLGRAASGLRLLLDGTLRPRGAGEREALKAHRMPEPRCQVGLWLARNRMASCMIDLSDGLSMDLPRLCSASGTGAEVFACRLPVFDACRRWSCDPLELALHGGEDFELLFAVPAARAARFERLYPRRFPPATRIGRLTGEKEVMLAVAPGAPSRQLEPEGFDHFAG